MFDGKHGMLCCPLEKNINIAAFATHCISGKIK